MPCFNQCWQGFRWYFAQFWQWLAHCLLGYPDLFYTQNAFGRWWRLISFGVFTVTLQIVDVATDINLITDLWLWRRCRPSLPWMIIITAVPLLPIIVSVVKWFAFQYCTIAPEVSLNWRLARQELIPCPEESLLVREGDLTNLEDTHSYAKNGILGCILDMYLVDFFRCARSFVQAWKTPSNEFIENYSPNNDVEFQDMRLQKSHLTEITYESAFQLFIVFVWGMFEDVCCPESALSMLNYLWKKIT